MAKHVCDVAECGEEIPEGRGSKGGLPICDKCRSASYYWKSKGLQAIKERRNKLHFWDMRFDYLSPRIREMLSDARERVNKARKSARGSENSLRH